MQFFNTDGPRRKSLLATILVYALLQMLYISATPLQVITMPDNLPSRMPQSLLVGIGPDEKEHFLYMLSLATHGTLPRPSPKARRNSEEYVTYQAQHPPLFYAAAAVVYKLVSPLPAPAIWYILRGFCAVCGVFVIVLGALACREAFPGLPFMRFAAAPFIAFMPMFGHMMGTLSNEPMAMVLTAWAWLQMVRLARGLAPLTWRTAALLGLTLGIAAETRLTAVMWLPAAVLVLAFCARRQGARPARPAALGVFALCFAGLTLPWFLLNHIQYGAFLLRPFARPLLHGITLTEFLADPAFPQIAELTALWYASTSWLPFWLVQFDLPGGLKASAAWQSPFLILDVFTPLALFLHGSRERREGKRKDAAGVILLWGAGSVVGVCILSLIQQQLFSDWDVLYSPGRYTVAAVCASALLFLFGCAVLFRQAKSPWLPAVLLAIFMLAFDMFTVSLVRQFYQAHPMQNSVQRL